MDANIYKRKERRRHNTPGKSFEILTCCNAVHSRSTPSNDVFTVVNEQCSELMLGGVLWINQSESAKARAKTVTLNTPAIKNLPDGISDCMSAQ